MPRTKKVEEVKDDSWRDESWIAPIAETFGNADINVLKEKINELVYAANGK